MLRRAPFGSAGCDRARFPCLHAQRKTEICMSPKVQIGQTLGTRQSAAPKMKKKKLLSEETAMSQVTSLETALVRGGSAGLTVGRMWLFLWRSS